MAQHIDAHKVSDGTIQKIVANILAQKYYRTSMKYRTVERGVYETDRRVPEHIVCGGIATFQVHTDEDGHVTNIYMVA